MFKVNNFQTDLREHIDEMAQRKNTDANELALRNAERLQRKAEKMQKPKTADFLDRELEIVKQHSFDKRKRMRAQQKVWLNNMDRQPPNPKFATSASKFSSL